MCSKQQLKCFLSTISEKAEFPIFIYVSAEKYTILIKCRVESNRNAEFYNDYAKEWINKFTKFTKTGWIVKTCFPHVKRLLYRKVFACHHSNRNKRKTPEQSGAKNKNCNAKIDFKIKFINRNTIKNDKMLRDGFNLTIYIDFVHSHGIKAREYFNLLKCSADTDEMFYKYFSEGHTPTTAKIYHQLFLLSKFGSTKHLLNGDINPTVRHVVYLFNKKKKQGLIPKVADIMREKVKALEECGGVLRHTDDCNVTVVITPFMKNVLSGHELDCIIVDSTIIKECVVSFFLVPTPLGALPIACALHSQITEHSLSRAFFSTKLLLENQTLKSFEPTKIMTNQIDEQLSALDAIFSDKELFVSRASLIEEIWKTICEGEAKIDNTQQHDVMELFSSLLHADNLGEAELFYKELEMYLSAVEHASKLKEYLTNIWMRREDYITPNKGIDISLRMLKQFLLNRCKAYNRLIMIDVLLNILDNHWCQILNAHLRGTLLIETYTKFLPLDKRLMESSAGLEIAGQCKLERTTNYATLRADTMCCNCTRGRKGELCSHLCAVLHTVATTTSIPEEKRAFYTALAGEHEVKVDPEVQSETECDDQEEYNMEEACNEDLNEHAVVKQEIEEHSDPLNDEEEEDNSEHNSTQNDIVDVKESYLNALRALNDEFRRINQMFRQNPSASNMDTMGRLTRELSKIKPVEKINLENMFVEDEVTENGSDINRM